MTQPTPAPRPEGTTIQADGKKSINDYAATFYHDPALGTALASVQQKLSVTDPAKPQPKGTILQIPGTLVGKGNSKTGGYQIDAAYRRTGAVVLVEDPGHEGSFFEGPGAGSKFPVNIRQFVNERTLHCGKDSKGWVRNVWFAPAGSMKVDGTTWSVATILTIRVRFLSNPLLDARSERTDPPWGVIPRSDFQMQPAGLFPNDDDSWKRSGEDNEQQYSGKLLGTPCSKRPTEYTITKLLNPGDPPFVLAILFGIGGGDQCEVSATAGDPKKAFQSVVTFTNWRRVYYEIVAPDNLTGPILEVGSPFAKKFNSTIEKFLIDKLEKAYIHFVQLSFTPIIMANNPDGSIPGSTVGMDRDKVLLGSQASLINLLRNIPQCPKKNTIRFVLFDMLFKYSPIHAIKDVSAKVFSAKQKSLFLAKINDPRLGIIYANTTIPPETLDANILGRKYRSPAFDINKMKWSAIIPEPSIYFDVPGAQWATFSDQPISSKITADTMLLRLTNSKGSIGPRTPLTNTQGKEIETSVGFNTNSATFSSIGAQNLSDFIKIHLKKDNIRTGKFNLEIFHSGKTTLSPTDQQRIDAIKDCIKNSHPLNNPIYIHPCLDAKGAPIQGNVPISWISNISPDSIEFDIETSLLGNKQMMGDLISEYDTLDTAPFEITFEAATAEFMPGFYISGSNQIAYSSKIPLDNNGQSRAFSLAEFGRIFLHEIGHAMGMAPFSNTSVANRARATSIQATPQTTPNYHLADPPPGCNIPLNVDEKNQNGKPGTTYFDSYSPQITGQIGIRDDHRGPHCAFGIPATLLGLKSFNGITFINSAKCIMFGSLSTNGDEFCPICKTTLLARSLDDLQSPWSGRS